MIDKLNPLLPPNSLIESTSSVKSNDRVAQVDKNNGQPFDPRFQEFLQSELNRSQELKFSAHAERRLKSRNLELDTAQLKALDNAVKSAAAKGSRDSLVLLDNLALLVNIPNRTVITAMDRDELETNIITNIDSAVFASEENK